MQLVALPEACDYLAPSDQVFALAEESPAFVSGIAEAAREHNVHVSVGIHEPVRCTTSQPLQRNLTGRRYQTRSASTTLNSSSMATARSWTTTASCTCSTLCAGVDSGESRVVSVCTGSTGRGIARRVSHNATRPKAASAGEDARRSDRPPHMLRRPLPGSLALAAIAPRGRAHLSLGVHTKDWRGPLGCARTWLHARYALTPVGQSYCCAHELSRRNVTSLRPRRPASTGRADADHTAMP